MKEHKQAVSYGNVDASAIVWNQVDWEAAGVMNTCRYMYPRCWNLGTFTVNFIQ